MERGRGRVPLERALSKLGLASRAEARELIRSGRVRIGGRVAADPLAPVVPERAAIAVDGRPVERPAPLTILLNKPRGVVTTRSDPEGRPTVYTCLTGLEAHVVPVGRLDAATSGLLLFSNDTRFADWVTDPANAVPRVYTVTVRKRSRRESHLIVELTEGKNREVRRLLAAAGHAVTRLKRVSFGGLTLGDLPPGSWRPVAAEELRAAFPGAPVQGENR